VRWGDWDVEVGSVSHAREDGVLTMGGSIYGQNGMIGMGRCGRWVWDWDCYWQCQCFMHPTSGRWD
jgi:hypothetical protein